MLRPLLAVAFVGALALPVSASSTPGLPELTAKVTVRSISSAMLLTAPRSRFEHCANSGILRSRSTFASFRKRTA